jgi:ATP-dependent Clp protease protease subunit
VADDVVPTMPWDAGGDVASRLLDRRIVLMSGEIDAARATSLAAQLMTLDATGDDPIEVRLSSCAGTIDASFAIIDVISVLGVAVRTSALGTIAGGPVGVLVAGERRSIAHHGRLRLREPDSVVSGSARDVERAVAEQVAVRSLFFDHLSARVHRPATDVEAEWARSSSLEALDAIALGYVDQVLGDPSP